MERKYLLIPGASSPEVISTGEARRNPEVSIMPRSLASLEMTFARTMHLLILAGCFFFTASSIASAGTLTGKISFSGQPPVLSQVDMGADPACQGAVEGNPSAAEVVVNPNGTLQNVFVYVKEGLEGKNFPAPETPVTLDQKGCFYHPRVFGIQAGQPLEILNSDATLHNVHGLPKTSREFNLGMPVQGMKLNRKFDQPEIMVKFKCDVHPWMAAYAGVLTHPFFSVSDKEGSYKIENLPPGSYTLEAWHEKYGVKTLKVTVPESGEAAADFSFSA